MAAGPVQALVAEHPSAFQQPPDCIRERVQQRLLGIGEAAVRQPAVWSLQLGGSAQVTRGGLDESLIIQSEPRLRERPRSAGVVERRVRSGEARVVAAPM